MKIFSTIYKLNRYKSCFLRLFMFLLLIINILAMSSCVKNHKKYIIETKKNDKLDNGINYESNDFIYIANEKIEINDYNLFENNNIYLLKNQSAGQILSVLVINNNQEIVVFDGGRIEDAEFLINFINNFNLRVKYWFITHIHDDHLGALYKICLDYKSDVDIENICYCFPEFKWLYEKVGNDVGSMLLFEDSIYEYQKYKLENENFQVNIINNLKKSDKFVINDINIQVLNDVYYLEHDIINNSSVAYKAVIEDKSMIVLGDLSYYGGERLLSEYKDSTDLKSDIVVVAHHGQSGVDRTVYEKISPKFALWPTTKSIYFNEAGHYKTDEVKKWFSDIGILKNITTIEYSQMLK